MTELQQQQNTTPSNVAYLEMNQTTMPATEHTWTTAERKAAKRFARSLPDERLETARDLTRRTSASAEDVVDVLAKHKQELSRVAGTFRINKPDIVSS